MVFKSLGIAFLYLVLSPFSAVILYYWRKLFYKIKGLSGITLLAMNKRDELNRINNMYIKLMDNISSIY